MAEYIERDALLEMINGKLRDTCNGKLNCLQVKRMVESIPAADVGEVRHGRWEKFRVGKDDSILRLRCSCCRKVVYEREFNYCHNCGADMRGADNGE